jgi:hypothetical protein
LIESIPVYAENQSSNTLEMATTKAALPSEQQLVTRAAATGL